MKKTIGIYPFVNNLKKNGDKHQLLFSKALIENGYNVKCIEYTRGLPIKNALKSKVDVLILDWVHSFYTSSSLIKTLVKSFLGIIELQSLNKGSTKIIWNLHNLQRHDGKFNKIEKFCFRQLARKVDFIRVFDKSHIIKASKYLNINSKKIVAIPQGPYTFCENVEVDIKRKYNIDKNKNILLFFGSVREGKGLEDFLNNFTNSFVEDWVLLITGKAIETKLESYVNEFASKHAQIIFDNRYIPDNEVSSYFKQAQSLVLPYQNTLNSGVLLLAKSFGTPVLANFNFKELVGNNDLIGNLSDSGELKKILNYMKSRRIKSSENTYASWNEVVDLFKMKF